MNSEITSDVVLIVGSLAFSYNLMQLASLFKSTPIRSLIILYIKAAEAIFTLYIVTGFFSINPTIDIIGFSLYSKLLVIYQFVHTGYTYMCISIAILIFSYNFPETTDENEYFEKFTCLAHALIGFFYIEIRTFSQPVKFFAGVFPFVYFSWYYRQSNGNNYWEQIIKLGIFFVFGLIGYNWLCLIDIDRFFVISFEMLVIAGIPTSFRNISHLLYNFFEDFNKKRCKEIIRNKGCYTAEVFWKDLIAIIMLGACFLLILYMSVVLPKAIHFIMIYGYSKWFALLLEIMHCIHSKDADMYRGKHFDFYFSQIIFLAYIWYFWISPNN